jgi:hypothetical protein
MHCHEVDSANHQIRTFPMHDSTTVHDSPRVLTRACHAILRGVRVVDAGGPAATLPLVDPQMSAIQRSSPFS